MSDPFSAWIGANPVIAGENPYEEVSAFVNGLPDGSRVQVALQYPESVFNYTPGHTILCAKLNGKIIFTDPQLGGIIKSPDEDYFIRTAKKGVSYCRIDNLEISDRGINACKEG